MKISEQGIQKRGYDPATHWERRGKHFGRGLFTELRQQVENANLLSWTKEVQPRRILEVGSGWGLVHILLDSEGLADKLTMCDFVESMRKGCKRKTGVLPDWWNGITLPYPDSSFDLILTRRVLQHVPPEDIEAFLCEEVRVASQWIFVASRSLRFCRPGSTMFVHDYHQLFGSLGLEIDRERCFGKVSHWLFRKPNSIEDRGRGLK